MNETHFTYGESRTCETILHVHYQGEKFALRLSMIAGGTPHLSFERDFGAGKRYPVVAMWASGQWDKAKGCYDFQDPNNIVGPALSVLPNGLQTVTEFIDEKLPELRQRVEERARESVLQAIENVTGTRRYNWPVREVEEEPRFIPCKRIGVDTYACLASSLVTALKGAPGRNKGTVLWGDVIMGVTQIRQYVTLLERNIDTRDCRVEVTMHADRIEMRATLDRNLKKNCTIKHGAWDKYRGETGWDCELVWDVR